MNGKILSKRIGNYCGKVCPHGWGYPGMACYEWVMGMAILENLLAGCRSCRSTLLVVQPAHIEQCTRYIIY